jgi:hypothetical protein
MHKTDLSEELYSTATKWWFMCYWAYGGTMFFAKLSIAWFLLRVTVSRLHRWIIYIAAIFSTASCLCYIFVALFQCNPISYYYDKNQPGSCIDIHIVVWLLYLYSSFAVISDFTFALLPAWVVSHLNMKKSMKVALIVLMGMGCMYVRPFSTLPVLSVMRLMTSVVRAQEWSSAGRTSKTSPRTTSYGTRSPSPSGRRSSSVSPSRRGALLRCSLSSS